MGTKWKNRKKAISFMVFVLGVSLMLGSVIGILKAKPDRVKIWELDRLLEDDYQEGKYFRDYIAGRLETFLIMAVGGSGLGNVWQSGDGVYYQFGYGGYDDPYGYGFNYDYYGQIQSTLDNLTYSLESLQYLYDLYYDRLEGAGADSEDLAEELAACRRDMEAYRRELRLCRETLEEYWSGEGAGGWPQDSEGQDDAAKQNQMIIRKYHDLIKGDKNLLYSISYDGKVLYSNGELTVDGGNITAPEGYNFFLYFDGDKVKIVKDGKEVDVYGDGYYRDGSDGNKESGWYVPGYLNFPATGEIRKATICMALAKEPVYYMDGVYMGGASGRYDNALYWMNYNRQADRNIVTVNLSWLAAGLIMLFLSLPCMKGRKEAKRDIACFQAKIWVECKVLLLGILAVVIWGYIMDNPLNFREEWAYAFEGDYSMEIASYFGREIFHVIPTPLYILAFWAFYLLCNDLVYNKKIWRHGLVAKLYTAFHIKCVDGSPAGKMALRNRAVFASAIAFGILVSVLALAGAGRHGNAWVTGIGTVTGLLVFLGTAYAAGAKNMRTARDLEALSRFVGEIRDGNYGDAKEDFSGHDLEDIRKQLEDVRCGMAKAVDEQMKSERMKVELIANVSHDIKTPLTSIISYVQFLKQEQGLPDHVKEYVAILDDKSQRLNNMVQDVFAVSKAASGELPVHMEELDFCKLLCQTLADMEEEIGKSPVVFRTEIPQEPIMIMADGQRLYRVFQNLFQNAIKYSLEGSRVYVDLKAEGQMAVAGVKNTSRRELEKGVDFVERFARGDKSRTDGGSGLGLSIAQSFTEACGGQFGWKTEADLFVVRVAFRRKTEEPG